MYVPKASTVGTVLLTEACLLTGGDKNDIGQLSCPQRGEFVPATVEQTLTKEKTISAHLSQASLRSLPSPCLFRAVCPPAGPVSTPLFYLKHAGWVSKLHTLGIQHGANIR